MNITHHLPGSVCWVDLGTPDPAASIAFYGSLFGWTFTTPDSSGYRLALLGGRAAAGLGPAADSGDPYWTVNVSTPDIARSLTAVEAAGGSVIEPATAARRQGIAAVTRSPSAVPLSLWQPLDQHGMQVAHEPGAFDGLTLHCERPDEQARYLKATLGWTQRGRAGLHAADLPVAVESGHDRTDRWLVHFAVNDHATAVQHAVALGATATIDGELRDPQGALFGLTR